MLVKVGPIKANEKVIGSGALCLVKFDELCARKHLYITMQNIHLLGVLGSFMLCFTKSKSIWCLYSLIRGNVLCLNYQFHLFTSLCIGTNDGGLETTNGFYIIQDNGVGNNPNLSLYARVANRMIFRYR